VEEKQQAIVFQVSEAVPVMFSGELSWHSANTTTENVNSYLEISGTRGRIYCMKDGYSGLIQLSGRLPVQQDDLPSAL